jgi:hypothetical protein
MKIEIDDVHVDEIIITRLKETKDLLRGFLYLPATSIEGDEQDLIACCEKLIAYYSPIQQRRLAKKVEAIKAQCRNGESALEYMPKLQQLGNIRRAPAAPTSHRKSSVSPI